MKKTLLAITALLCLSAGVLSAQEKEPEIFGGYWFIHAQGGVGYTVGETSDRSSLFSPAAALSFGYQFTPVWSLRAGLYGWEGKGAVSDAATYLYSYNFLQGNVDVVVDLCNIARYRRTRTLNPYIFAGIGFEGGINNDEALALPSSLFPGRYRWDTKGVDKYSFVGRAGVGLDIRLVDAVHLTVEVNANAYDDHFNSKKETYFDWQLNGLVGLKFNIGMKKSRERAAARAAAKAPAPVYSEPQIVEKVVEKVVEKEVIKEVAPQFKGERRDIWFTINRYDFSENELMKIGEIIQILKDNADAKVTVSGYADAETGTARRNMYLSQKRAEAVAAKLYEAGISEDRVTVEWFGSENAPYGVPEKNRVAICVVR